MNNKGTINFVLFGARSTGKTTYLGSLFNNESTIISMGSLTMDYLKKIADNLRSGKYPEPTSASLHQLLFRYKYNNCKLRIQIDDVDGNIIETLHKKDDEVETTRKERDDLIKNIQESEGIIFLFPYKNNYDIESKQNFINFTDQIDTAMTEIGKLYKDQSIPISA